jgi:hypothetical protein
MQGLRAVGAGVLAMALVVTGPVAADQRGPAIIVVPDAKPGPSYAQPLSCWSDVRLFSTLRDGNFPYCRQKLRYRPGALECFQVTQQVCQVILPGSYVPVETTSQVDRQVIPCPDGPEPPVCRRLDVW